MQEVWKTVNGFDAYEVSNLGRVRRLHNIKKGKKKFTFFWYLSPIDNGIGYSQVILSQDGETKHFLIHRLVALHFLKKQKNENIVCFKNGDKNNFRVDNICWGEGSKEGRGRISTPVIQKSCLTSRILNIYSSAVCAAEEMRVRPVTIRSACNGKIKTCKGYKWEYKK